MFLDVVVKLRIEQAGDVEQVAVQVSGVNSEEGFMVSDAVPQLVESSDAGIDIGPTGAGGEGTMQGRAP